jgi:hypothetical protein
MAKEAATHDQSEASLLALPEEIRNRIHHLCLIEGVEIFITSELKPPALLSTCRQIRNEAQQIYYFGNTFAIVMLNCDSTLYRQFTKDVVRPLGIQPDDPRWRSVAELERVDWRNLMSWYRCVWEGKLGGVKFFQTLAVMAITTGASFRMQLS